MTLKTIKHSQAKTSKLKKPYYDHMIEFVQYVNQETPEHFIPTNVKLNALTAMQKMVTYSSDNVETFYDMVYIAKKIINNFDNYGRLGYSI